MYESLRQKCVYQVIANEPIAPSTDVAQPSKGSFNKWFDYTVDYLDNCLDNTTFGHDCATKYMKNAGINHEKVE